MMERCGNCKHRGTRNDGGCTYSGELPIIPNPDSKCVFIKTEGRSKFEPNLKREQGGRLIAAHQPTDSAPGVAVKPGKPPDMSGRYVVVCRDHKSFIHDTKTDEVFSDSEERKPMGKIQDFDEPTYSPEEMDKAIAAGRKLMLKHLTE